MDMITPPGWLIRDRLAELLLWEEGSEWADDTERHYELADAILARFEVQPKPEAIRHPTGGPYFEFVDLPLPSKGES
jgi:hypothetical protein